MLIFLLTPQFGGTIHAATSSGSLLVTGTTITSSAATISGGGIFVDAGYAGMLPHGCDVVVSINLFLHSIARSPGTLIPVR